MVVIAVLTSAVSAGTELAVVSVAPAARTVTAPTWAGVTVQFDREVDAGTVTASSFRAFGRWSGAVTGTYSLSPDGTAVTLDPDEPFSAGEQVMVVLSHDLAGTDGAFLRAAGYSYQFWTRARVAAAAFPAFSVMSTNAGPESSRPYGGIGSDLDNDGWLDITTVNEDTADLRVFMNDGDGTGSYASFSQPTSPVNVQASPSEPADFNADGNTDICVCNISTSSVSILLGNGDGTFGPQQEITVGGDPRGIAVLDIDGDGDLDIANTNFSSNEMSILRNDGAGVFSSPFFFEGGGNGEWSLAAADMDEDGLLDLVMGARFSADLHVLRNNGDTTFTNIATTSGVGQTWMIAVGDVNGDGHEDVVSANSGSNHASVVLGTGTGGLGASVSYAVDPFPLATDLGDLDGDGDLDWSVSSFQGDWRLFENDGSGGYSFLAEIDAPSNASCSIMLDIDNDADLDLALIDEIADVVDLRRNGGTNPLADVNNDGAVDIDDIVTVILGWGPCPFTLPCVGDANGDGVIDIDDVVAVVLEFD
jgi:hypothetical protein